MPADETIFCKEREQVLAQTVKQLPQQQQLVYMLSRKHGWKREEIARQLKVSPFTVKGHMQKALRFLRERVGNTPT